MKKKHEIHRTSKSYNENNSNIMKNLYIEEYLIEFYKKVFFIKFSSCILLSYFTIKIKIKIKIRIKIMSINIPYDRRL